VDYNVVADNMGLSLFI